MDNYNVLRKLDDITQITSDDSDNFLMMDNETTHSDMMLQEPEYEPEAKVDNRAYDYANQDRFTVNGVTMNMWMFLLRANSFKGFRIEFPN